LVTIGFRRLDRKEYLARNQKTKCPDEARVSNWWDEGLNRWNEEAFKDNFRVNHGTYEFILRQIKGV
jgi:hypothetical protein